jgi:hypothetical protein
MEKNILDLPFGHRRSAPSMSILDIPGHMYLPTLLNTFSSRNTILHTLTSCFSAQSLAKLESYHESSLLGHDKLNEMIYVSVQNPNCPQCERKYGYMVP